MLYYNFDTLPKWRRMTAVHEFGHAIGWRHEQERVGVDFTTCPGFGGEDEIPASVERYLTVPDKDSVMYFAECQPDRAGASGNWRHSSLDALGVAIVYPPSFEPKIKGLNGFPTPSGIVVRPVETITTEWTAFGAHSSAFQTVPTWSRSGAFIATGFQFSAGLLMQGTNALTVGFQDVFGRTHIGSISADVNSARHTAQLITAALSGI